MKNNYLSWFGWYLFVAFAGLGFFVVYYETTKSLYLSVIIGCLISAMGAGIIPPLKSFKIKSKGGK